MTQCQCPAAGWCETHQREMPAPFWKLCHDSPGYFEQFQKQALQRTGFHCVHRGGLIRQFRCKPCQNGGLGPLAPVFHCRLHSECTLTTVQGARLGGGKRGKPMPTCAVCAERTAAEQSGAGDGLPDMVEPPGSAAPDENSGVDLEPKPGQTVDRVRKQKPTGMVVNRHLQPADHLAGMYAGCGCFLVLGGPGATADVVQAIMRRGLLVASVNQAAYLVQRG